MPDTDSLDRFRLYRGAPDATASRKDLPPFEPDGRLTAPELYFAADGLRDAVNVALALGQPLLVTGDPGTGKTRLAWSVADEFGLGAPLVFNTKTTSTGDDLFYRYDALRHYHAPRPANDTRTREEQIRPFIDFNALGLAILRAGKPDTVNFWLPERFRIAEPQRSVVLIDEIDKAPRDLPNDILNEIEHMAFTVREVPVSFTAEQKHRPVVILTSNSERDLPDAFLRRCVFYHIPSPTRADLLKIVRARIGGNGAFTPEMLEHAVDHFEEIRKLALRRKPATAELLAWAALLERLHIDPKRLQPGQAELLAFTYSALAKHPEDLAELRKLVPKHSGG